MTDSSPRSERPLHDYIDMEAYDVVSGETYRNLKEQLDKLSQAARPFGEMAQEMLNGHLAGKLPAGAARALLEALKDV